MDVVLTKVGSNPIQIIKVVTESTGLGLMEARELISTLPAMIKAKVDLAEAKKIRIQLMEASPGATVDLK